MGVAMKRWVLCGLLLGTVFSVVFLEARRFDFKSAQLFLKAHQDAFEKMRIRTERMKERIDNRVFWCKCKVYPQWVKECVAIALRDEMLLELKQLKEDLKNQILNHPTADIDDPMALFIESMIKSMESQLKEYNMLPIVEKVAAKKG
jgi:membrane protein CcdC involved in cytochrome C biogenesis